MNRREMTRREFLKIVGSSSMLMTLPMSGGCLNWQGFTVSLVKDPDDSYAVRKSLDMIEGLDFLNSGDNVLLKLFHSIHGNSMR